VDASPPLTCHSFSVRPEARFSAPTRGRLKQPRAGAVKAGRFWRPPAGLGLDSSEHGCPLKAVGAEVIVIAVDRTLLAPMPGQTLASVARIVVAIVVLRQGA
jgi:hypothetical protein